MASEEGGHKDEVEVGKIGVKVSYVRFLADSAAGYITLLLVLLALHTAELVPEFKDAGTKIALLALLTIIATPVGLAINGISWFALCWLIYILELGFILVTKRIADNDNSVLNGLAEFYASFALWPRLLVPATLLAINVAFIFWPLGWIAAVGAAIIFMIAYPVILALFVWPSADRCSVGDTTTIFGIDEYNWWQAKQIEEILDIHFSKAAARIEYIEGGMIFIRSMAFVFFCLALVRVYPFQPCGWTWNESCISAASFARACVVAGTCCLWISALIYFYRTIAALFIARVVSYRGGERNLLFEIVADRNVKRWDDAGKAAAWVAGNNATWDHDDWNALLRELRETNFWPMDIQQLGILLEKRARQH